MKKIPIFIVVLMFFISCNYDIKEKKEEKVISDENSKKTKQIIPVNDNRISLKLNRMQKQFNK